MRQKRMGGLGMTQSRLNKCCHKLKYQIADTQMMVLKNQIPYMGAYFVHHQGELLGVSWLEDTKLI